MDAPYELVPVRFPPARRPTLARVLERTWHVEGRFACGRTFRWREAEMLALRQWLGIRLDVMEPRLRCTKCGSKGARLHHVSGTWLAEGHLLTHDAQLAARWAGLLVQLGLTLGEGEALLEG